LRITLRSLLLLATLLLAAGTLLDRNDHLRALAVEALLVQVLR
jgi:hypothetical protein